MRAQFGFRNRPSWVVSLGGIGYCIGRIVAAGNTLDVLKDRKLLEAHSLELPPSFTG